MTLSADQRAAFVGLLPRLAAGADGAEAVQFFLDHREGCLAELGAVPGHDQVRVGMLRVLPGVLGEGEALDDARDRVRAALETFDPAAVDARLAVRRHPSWVALGWIELAEQTGGALQAAWAKAITVAGEAFATLAPHDARGPAEVAWAIAEAAEEAGWSARANEGLDAALEAPFADAENRGRVALVRALAWTRTDGAQAADHIDRLLDFEVLDPQTHVHALWVGALLDREQDHLGRAIARLTQARELVDEADEPEIAARIDAMLEAIGAKTKEPGEA